MAKTAAIIQGKTEKGYEYGANTSNAGATAFSFNREKSVKTANTTNYSGPARFSQHFASPLHNRIQTVVPANRSSLPEVHG